MPVSHICPHCGVELGHTAPVPDPIYALPLVACPGCGRRTPRRPLRRHPLLVLARGIRGTAFSLLLLAASAAVFLMFAAAVTGSAEALSRSLDQSQIGPRSLLLERDGPGDAGAVWRALRAWCSTPAGLIGLAYLAAVLSAGAYLRTAIGHCHALVALAVFVAAVAVLSAFSHIVAAVGAAFITPGALPGVDLWTRDAVIPAMMAVPVVVGFPIGVPLRWLAKAARRNVRFAMLRRARTRRAAA